MPTKVFLYNLSANRWTCADMGEGDQKSRKKTADVLCEWPLGSPRVGVVGASVLLCQRYATESGDER